MRLLVIASNSYCSTIDVLLYVSSAADDDKLCCPSWMYQCRRTDRMCGGVLLGSWPSVVDEFLTVDDKSTACKEL